MTGSGNHTYLLCKPGGCATLIDAGIGNDGHLRSLSEQLAAHGAHLDDVLVTHAHPDHASGVTALAAAFPAAKFSKYPWPDQDEKYSVTWRILHDGQIMPAGDTELTVLHTPGHSPDHLSFWHEGSRTVFSGDLVVLGSSVMIHASGGGDLGQYLSSLDRVRTLAPARLLPAHGAMIGDPETVLTGYIEHRLQRERQVVDALQAGSTTVESIAESIYHGLDSRLVPAAMETVRAHLAKLMVDGRVSQNSEATFRLRE